MPTVACPSCRRHDLETSVLASQNCLYCGQPWPKELVERVAQSDPFYTELITPASVVSETQERAMLRNDWPDVPTYVPCENCAEQTLFGGHACTECGCVFDLGFWAEWAADHPYDFNGDPMFEDIDWLDDEILPTDLGFKTSDWFDFRIMLCCDQDSSDCQCDIPLSWHDGWDSAKDMESRGFDVYHKGQQSVCSGCINFYTPNCLPLRAWARSDDHYGTISRCSIDVCGNFVHFEILEAAKKKWLEYEMGAENPIVDRVTPADDGEWDGERELYESDLPFQTIRDLNQSIKHITDRMSQ